MAEKQLLQDRSCELECKEQTCGASLCKHVRPSDGMYFMQGKNVDNT